MTALIAAIKYVCEEGDRVCVCLCVCVCVCVCVCDCVGVIAWVWKGVCGWDSLDCCR